MAEETDMLLTIADEVRKREERRSWGNAEELLAGTITQLSLVRREALAGLGVKDLPEVVIPRRPGDPAPATRKASKYSGRVMSPASFAKHMTGAP